MGETRQVHFSVEGEFITSLAREKLFMNKDLAGAIKLLRSCLMSDQLSSNEQLILCLQILHGAASIKGNSDSDDYGVEFRDDINEHPTDISSISQMITDMDSEIESLKKENRDMMYKMSFMAGQFEDYKLERINADYYNETGEPLFSDMAIPDWRKAENQLSSIEWSNDACQPMSSMLESFLAQRRYEDEAAENDEEPECPYGWLEPDGTFHPVPWGNHSTWARDYLDEHFPFKDNPEIYWRIDKDGKRHHIVCGDVLVFSLGWILLDNPYQGQAKVTKNPNKDMTKAQKEFLYDYFIKRNRYEEANALYQD